MVRDAIHKQLLYLHGVFSTTVFQRGQDIVLVVKLLFVTNMKLKIKGPGENHKYLCLWMKGDLHLCGWFYDWFNWEEKTKITNSSELNWFTTYFNIGLS